MEIIDITQEVFSCRVFPGDMPPKRQVAKVIDKDGYMLTNVSMCVHNGTHVDAPLHFLAEGAAIDGVDLSVFFGPCTVGEVRCADAGAGGGSTVREMPVSSLAGGTPGAGGGNGEDAAELGGGSTVRETPMGSLAGGTPGAGGGSGEDAAEPGGASCGNTSDADSECDAGGGCGADGAGDEAGTDIDACPVESCTPLGRGDVAPLLASKPKRLLIKGEHCLSPEAAEAVAAAGVRLIGVESQSVGEPDAPAGAHLALLGAGVVPLEGLDLKRVAPGEYTLCAFPLKLGGAEGSPVRAVLMKG
ncbi:MAG: cyclase family protein [Lachnospiraceae bacterium]|jgi:kynurenine formamidase|nr:cyclase family protein [Lachnospiraceae bacterium]